MLYLLRHTEHRYMSRISYLIFIFICDFAFDDAEFLIAEFETRSACAVGSRGVLYAKFLKIITECSIGCAQNTPQDVSEC